MAEKIVSPGVFTKEIDATFLPSAVADIGAAIVGPTVKGPALVPTVVTSMGEYEEIFGTTFSSGSGATEDDYAYLTSLAAKEYLKNSNQLTVVRILAGSYSHASANVLTGSGENFNQTGSAGDTETAGGGSANISFKLHTRSDGNILNNKKLTSGALTAASSTVTITVNDVDNIGQGDVISLITTGGKTVTCTLNGVGGTTTSATTDGNVEAATYASSTGNTTQATAQANSIATAINHNQYFTATNSANVVTITQAIGGSDGNTVVTLTELGQTGMTKTNFSGGLSAPVGDYGVLVSGSKDNLRFEVVSTNTRKGTFSLAIRSGDDTDNQKNQLETYNNVNLDPKSTNYIAKVIGDMKMTIRTDDDGNPFLQPSGSNLNNSKYVYVEVFKTTPEYLDANGEVRIPAQSSSLPAPGSGSFGGAFDGGDDGSVTHPMTFNENIASVSSQGLNPSNTGGSNGHDDYVNALKLLNNQDEYDFNLLMMPGIIDSQHSNLISKAIDICEDRGDCFVIVDPVQHGSSVGATKTEAGTRNSSYAAMYWPWVKMSDPYQGKDVWVPPSVAVAGVYSFNDQVAHPWFAPAGLNRGTLGTVKRAERKLTQSNRDTLYDANVNPIATFPGQGVVVYGQKTLQKKSSALDRINVRRLLIRVKKFVASSSKFLVFEQNTAATRRRFLDIANPFLEQIQAQSGLSAFRVVMDETNNTPDTIDRNYLVGQLFLQPTRTAEFIVLDFTVQRSGATFPE
tara:strand:- start:91 stop:2313 length:2223 start_codon:yes stop_codon:yes gene_type:complete